MNFKHNCSSCTSIWLFACYSYISLAHVHSWHFMWTFGCQLPPREQRFFASLRIPFVCEGRKGKTKQSNMLLPLCQQRESTRSTQMEGFHINGGAVGVSTQRRHCRDERCVLMRPAWEFNEAGRSEPKAMDAYWCEMFLGDSCLVALFLGSACSHCASRIMLWFLCGWITTLEGNSDLTCHYNSHNWSLNVSPQMEQSKNIFVR